MNNRKKRKYIVVFGYFVIVVILLGTMEFLSYVTSKYLANNGNGLYIHCIKQSFQNFSRIKNSVLGWPSTKYISKRDSFYDETGSRIIPAFPFDRQNMTCVSLYGDSYTEGYGVSHQEAWSNVLSKLLGCRVANYGVSGYGSDQAYLRYSLNHHDRAQIVILCHLSQNIMRNVNQLRNFIAPGPWCMLKPRFIVNNQGDLELVPIPKLTENEYNNLEKHPELYLKHEYYFPGGPSGVKTVTFPYTLSIIRGFGIIMHRLFQPKAWEELYQPDHPSKAFQVTVAIMKKFHDEAQDRGQYPIIYILPTRDDTKLYIKYKKIYYQTLIDKLRNIGIEVVDMAQKYSQYLQQNDPSVLTSAKTQYHYSVQGNKILAKITADYIKERKLLNIPGKRISRKQHCCPPR